MVRSDLGASGVMFTIDTETGFRDAVLINAAYGLGENVVQGSVNPDEYYVFKPTLRDGYRPILQKTSRHQGIQAGLRRRRREDESRTSRCLRPRRGRFAMTDDEILTLARWACLIEDHYSSKTRRARRRWTSNGRRTAAPASCSSCRRGRRRCNRARTRDVIEIYHLQARGTVLVTGRSVGEKIASGPVRVIKSVQSLRPVSATGEVLVTDKTDPDWEPIMKKAAAHRHQPRRPHLPCRHRQPRTGRAGDRRHRTRHRRLARRAGRHRLLRRGRHRLRLRREPAVRASSA